MLGRPAEHARQAGAQDCWVQAPPSGAQIPQLALLLGRLVRRPRGTSDDGGSEDPEAAGGEEGELVHGVKILMKGRRWDVQTGSQASWMQNWSGAVQMPQLALQQTCPAPHTAGPHGVVFGAGVGVVSQPQPHASENIVVPSVQKNFTSMHCSGLVAT